MFSDWASTGQVDKLIHAKPFYPFGPDQYKALLLTTQNTYHYAPPSTHLPGFSYCH